MSLAPCPRRVDCHRNAGHRGGCSRNVAEMARNTTRRTTTASSTGGSAVSDIQQAKAALMATSTKLTDAGGALQQGHGDTEEAMGLLMQAMEGTSQSEFDECRALIADATTKSHDARAAAAVAADRAESMAARL